ncbi:acetyl-CoA decarbonylase/synthase complex subunit gamma [Dissulfurirhabdus thermomarina]|uniref:Acetyl-CoA decarbonylase/synthase complex subunit gamma n=1 Tax=Dissulfurirhabdus thermomarina TaxID=1765737 RepID=A0A6N9TV43_DISTH|nr:acetyl-CoA decarbonylase/synthase complex subunit gamma [Dissulfurirhabdus thermomarina]NDY43297.1 acetyl-CoA decarbonylase/synthase complex subunit gamma [Dissulfurirhabdus thermomarina]NMX23511.1 acetyl-CoA decarbonylase/synthase complex subunit gamma [Dissulfurirhabdus thermomarina]
MALTGIQIMKMLPKKNCGECNVPTCLAFAMKVAAGQADIGDCPYVSDEVKEKVGEASAPPIRTVKLGSGDHVFQVGGETCLYRHEKRFEHPTGIAVRIATDMDDADIAGRLERFRTLRYDRVGVLLKADLVAVQDAGGDEAAFTALVERVRSECPDAALVLMSDSPAVLAAGAKACGDHVPLLYAATPENADQMLETAKAAGCPLAVRGATIGETAALAERLAAEVKDLVLDTGARTLRAAFEDQVAARRSAIRTKYRPLGFPTITFPCEMTDDPEVEAMVASVLVAKYAGIVVLSDLQGDTLFPLLLERLNLFTDPQRPMVVQEDVYPINGPDENSPVLVTCNFSLTYFIVSGEVEGSKVPSWLLIKDTEGLSVLTAWAAGKFSADLIAGFVKKSAIADKVKHRNLIIPGYLASIKGELEEELPDWNIQIGPREASHLPAFLREWQPN